VWVALAAALKPGGLPSAPLARSSVLELSTIRVKLLDFTRGDQAWHSIHAANPENVPPAPGREYALVQIRLTGVAPESWIGCKDFRIVGAERIVYACRGQVLADPLESSVLRHGQGKEGWCSYSIRASDPDFILMVDDSSPLRIDSRYIALDRGATLPAIPSADVVAARAIGSTRRASAELGSEVATPDWSIRLMEVVRGAEARRLVASANDKNQPPP
jgi:hypothetical protein